MHFLPAFQHRITTQELESDMLSFSLNSKYLSEDASNKTAANVLTSLSTESLAFLGLHHQWIHTLPWSVCLTAGNLCNNWSCAAFGPLICVLIFSWLVYSFEQQHIESILFSTAVMHCDNPPTLLFFYLHFLPGFVVDAGPESATPVSSWLRKESSCTNSAPETRSSCLGSWFLVLPFIFGIPIFTTLLLVYWCVLRFLKASFM